MRYLHDFGALCVNSQVKVLARSFLFQRMRLRGPILRVPGMRFFTSTGFAASAGSVTTADALPKPSRSAAIRWASAVMACMLSRLTSPPFTASPIIEEGRERDR